MKKAYKDALREVEEMALSAMSKRGKKGMPAPRPTPPDVEASENDYPHGVEGPPQGEVKGLKAGEDQGIEAPKEKDFAVLMSNHSPEELKRLKEMYAKIAAMKG